MHELEHDHPRDHLNHEPDQAHPGDTRLDPFDSNNFRRVDDLGPGQRWSTWWDVERLQRGPEPRPDWVVTDSAAIDTDLGILKTGKEADCFLVERAVPGDPARRSLLVAKVYRDPDHRSFQRSASYTEGRSVRNSRDMRAIRNKSFYGRQVQAGQWAAAEWNSLNRLWPLGVPIPYPVQVDGTEILLEYLTDGNDTAPRLAQVRPDHDQLADLYEQLASAMELMTSVGVVHGDLSPYNLLVSNGRIMIIDLPQMVDLVANPNGMDFLHRDCVNVCTWFARRGLAVDGEELFARMVAAAW